jgi:hypothetical protein
MPMAAARGVMRYELLDDQRAPVRMSAATGLVQRDLRRHVPAAARTAPRPVHYRLCVTVVGM